MSDTHIGMPNRPIKLKRRAYQSAGYPSRPLNACRSRQPLGSVALWRESVHPGRPGRLRTFLRSAQTSLFNRIGKLDTRHPETFDHDTRQAEAQSLLLRVAYESRQRHQIIVHRHQLVSHRHVSRKPTILSVEAMPASAGMPPITTQSGRKHHVLAA